MLVVVSDRQKDLSVDPKDLRKMVSFILRWHHCTHDQVIVNLVSTAKISALHKKYFGDPSPTDCISFPIDPDKTSYPAILGEIFVCPMTAILYSRQHHLEPYEELTLYLVHALLHCMGYDDLNPYKRSKMRSQERLTIEAIAEAKLFLDPRMTSPFTNEMINQLLS